MFWGSATWRRWKSAPAGNSSVSVSSPRSRRPGLGEQARDRDRALAHGVEDAPLPRLGHLLELDVRRLGRRLSGRGAGIAPIRRSRLGRQGSARARCRGPCASRSSTRCASDSRERSECGRVTFTSASSSGRRGSAPCRDVLDRDREEVDEPQDGRLGELVRLLAQELLRLLGDGQRVGDVAHVLDEQQVPEMLEQVGDEPAEVLPLLRRAPRRRAARRPCPGRRPCRRAAAATPRRPRRRAAARTGRRSSCSSRRRAGRASTRRRGTSRGRHAR